MREREKERAEHEQSVTVLQEEIQKLVSNCAEKIGRHGGRGESVAVADAEG